MTPSITLLSFKLVFPETAKWDFKILNSSFEDYPPKISAYGKFSTIHGIYEIFYNGNLPQQDIYQFFPKEFCGNSGVVRIARIINPFLHFRIMSVDFNTSPLKTFSIEYLAYFLNNGSAKITLVHQGTASPEEVVEFTPSFVKELIQGKVDWKVCNESNKSYLHSPPELKWKNLDILSTDKSKIDLLDYRFNQFVHFFNENEGNYHCLETKSLNAHLWKTHETEVFSISCTFLLEQFKMYKNNFTHYAEIKNLF